MQKITNDHKSCFIHIKFTFITFFGFYFISFFFFFLSVDSAVDPLQFNTDFKAAAKRNENQLWPASFRDALYIWK